MKVKELSVLLAEIIADNPSDANIEVCVAINGLKNPLTEDNYQHVDKVEVWDKSAISSREVMLTGKRYDY